MVDYDTKLISARSVMLADLRRIPQKACATVPAKPQIATKKWQPFFTVPPSAISTSVTDFAVNSQDVYLQTSAAESPIDAYGYNDWAQLALRFNVDVRASATVMCAAGAKPIPVQMSLVQQHASMKFYTRKRSGTSWPQSYTWLSDASADPSLPATLPTRSQGYPVIDSTETVTPGLLETNLMPYAQSPPWRSQSNGPLLTSLGKPSDTETSGGYPWWDAHEAMTLDVDRLMTTLRGDAATICEHALYNASNPSSVIDASEPTADENRSATLTLNRHDIVSATGEAPRKTSMRCELCAPSSKPQAAAGAPSPRDVYTTEVTSPTLLRPH